MLLIRIQNIKKIHIKEILILKKVTRSRKHQQAMVALTLKDTQVMIATIKRKKVRGLHIPVVMEMEVKKKLREMRVPHIYLIMYISRKSWNKKIWFLQKQKVQ